MKTVLVVVVLAAVIGGGWYFYKHRAMPVVDNTPVQTNDQNTNAQQPAPQNLITSSDSSNASLEADLAAIDGGMSSVNSDSASIDSSMNDKMVAQTE